MIGMPTPYVEPSLWYSRTCTGWPVADGTLDDDGAADPPVEDACQAVDDGAPHAATSATAAPRTATPADRLRNRCLMTTTMLRRRPVGHPGSGVAGCAGRDSGPGEQPTPRA